MFTTRIAAAFAAGALAVGFLAGSAGTIVLRDATTPQSADWTAHMSQMGSMMNGTGGMMNGTGGMMNGTGGMMNGTGGMMNGTGGMMNGQGGTGPSPTSTPDGMQEHHVTPSPAPTQ